MTTKEKCLAMMHKAAAAKRLNDKIMTKRAEYAEYRAQMQPSEAYIAGFCKAAEAYGVDPEELLKEAQWLKSIGQGIVGGAKALGNGYARLAGGTAGVLTGKGWQAGAQAGSNFFNKGMGVVGNMANKGMNNAKGMINNVGNMMNRGAQAIDNARSSVKSFMNNTVGGKLRNMFGVQQANPADFIKGWPR